MTSDCRSRASVLVLEARLAASRFRRRRGGGWPAWILLALNWRRPRGGRADRPVAGRTVVVREEWHPQFGLHFDVRMLGRDARRTPPGRVAAAALHTMRRIVMERHWLRLGFAGSATEPRRRFHTAASVPSLQRAAAGASRLASERPGSPAPGLTIVPLVAPGPRRAIVTRAQTKPGRPREARRRTHPVVAEMRVRAADVDVFRVPLLTRPSAATSRPTADATRPQCRDRPVELVWRVAPQPAAAVSVEDVRPDRTVRASRPLLPEFAEPTPFRPVARDERTVATAIAQLAPGVVDRLTDDVIRRVERRVRIERERRGL